MKSQRPFVIDMIVFAALIGLHAICGSQRMLIADDSVTTIDGRTIAGSIRAIDEKGEIQWVDGSSLALSQVLSIQHGGVIEQPVAATIAVHLAYGGNLAAQTAQLQNERVSLTTSFGNIELPIESIRAIIFRPSAMTDLIREDIDHPSNQFDTVWAESESGPQKAEGLIRSIADGKLTGEFSGQERSVSQTKVIAFVAADLGLNPATGLARFHLADGSIIGGKIERLENDTLFIRFPEGGSISVPWSRVARITFESDRMVWLSDLQPVSDEQEPIVTLSNPTRFNLSVGGNPLTLRVSTQSTPLTYAKGLGVHAYSRVVYRNESGFDRLTAVVGIDAETQGNGDCVFSVRGDGVELWSKRVRGTDDPLPIEVDIGNVQEISLIVDPGEQLDLADHADWCEARLLKTK